MFSENQYEINCPVIDTETALVNLVQNHFFFQGVLIREAIGNQG